MVNEPPPYIGALPEVYPGATPYSKRRAIISLSSSLSWISFPSYELLSSNFLSLKIYLTCWLMTSKPFAF